MPSKSTATKLMRFSAILDIVGVNPFVHLPDKILTTLFAQSGKNRGPIPICGTINGKAYKQTLVKYRGHRRLYVNTSMLKNSPDRIGESVEITVMYDAADRSIPMHPKLAAALNKNLAAKKVFDDLPPSRRKEIVRYISFLKTDESVERNVARAISFLTGKDRFVGRDKP